MAKRKKPAKISFAEANKRIRAAGGHAWDNVKDPVGVIREMRGGAKVKKRPKPATAGKKIAGDVYPEGTIDHAICRMKLARRIDREVRKERDRCRGDVLAHARMLREDLSGCVSGVAEGWRQCIDSFERMVKP